MWLAAVAGVAMLAGQGMQRIALLAFAMSFSSTVFVVKVLEEAGRIARALRPRRHRHPGDAGHYRRGLPDGHQRSPAQPVGAGTGGSVATDTGPAQDLDEARPWRDAVTVGHRDGIGPPDTRCSPRSGSRVTSAR